VVATASPRRIRAPLPSNTQGPSSFLGVMGPSWPFIKAGWAVVGDGVLAEPRRSPVGIDELALRPDGMPMGVAVAFIEILRLLDDLGKPALALRLMLLLYGAMYGGASCMVMSIKSGSCWAGITGVGGTTCG
jgi:hypothetical protein